MASRAGGQATVLAYGKVKFISRRRGAQSDPTHALAPVWVCPGLPTRALSRAVRGCARSGAYSSGSSVWQGRRRPAVARIQRFLSDRFKRPTARFWYWPIRWPRHGSEKRVAGRFWGFLGLWCWRAMLASAGQGAACLFSLYACTVLDKPTVCVWSSLMLKPRLWQGLGVWPSVWLRAMLSPGSYPVNT